LQNEPNIKIAEMIVTACIIISYSIFRLAFLRKNEPKRTQNEPIFRPKLASFFPILALFHKEIFAFAKNLIRFADLQSKNAEHSCGRIRFYGKSLLFEEKSFENTQVSDNCCVNLCESVSKNISLESVKSVSKKSLCVEEKYSRKEKHLCFYQLERMFGLSAGEEIDGLPKRLKIHKQRGFNWS